MWGVISTAVIITIAFALWVVIDELEVTCLYSRLRALVLKTITILLFSLAVLQVWVETNAINWRAIESRETRFSLNRASTDP